MSLCLLIFIPITWDWFSKRVFLNFLLHIRDGENWNSSFPAWLQGGFNWLPASTTQLLNPPFSYKLLLVLISVSTRTGLLLLLHVNFFSSPLQVQLRNLLSQVSPLIRDGYLECLGVAAGAALWAAPLPASASSAGTREQPIDLPGSVQSPAGC